MRLKIIPTLLLVALSITLPCFLDLAEAQNNLIVRGDKINVRSGPGLQFASINQVGNGTMVTEKTRRGDWVEIVEQSTGKTGWIHSRLLRLKGTLRVVGESVNIRSGPGIHHGTIGQASFGTEVLGKSQQGEWIEISYPVTGGSAWIYGALLEGALPDTTLGAATKVGGQTVEMQKKENEDAGPSSLIDGKNYIITYEGKKVLFIDSYHNGYPWSDGQVRGVMEALRDTKIEVKVYSMDTKRIRDKDSIKASALKAKEIIETFKPDVVIAGDDNANKYLIAPYFKDTDLPVVFCGVNWDASDYGFPTSNVTGVIEVDLLKEMLGELRLFAKGDRLGTVYLNTNSARKIIDNHERLLDIRYDKVYLVDNYEEWTTKFLKIQDEVDMLIIGNQQGMADWDEEGFTKLALEHTKIPTGTTGSWRMPFTLLGFLRIPEEQGHLAAKAVLRILNGEKPGSIPVVANKEASIVINQGLSDALDITFGPELLKEAKIIWP